jgi:4-phytase/acid phosphatase
MLRHIERTLDQRVEGRPLADATGPTDSKLVLLAGHDTNLAGVAALLGLHWTLDGRTDDTPPGAELAFELWQNGSGAWSVRITVAMQTLRQMREMQDLTPGAPPARQILTLEGCGAAGLTCSWKDCQHIANAAIDRGAVFPEKSNQP